MDTAPEIEEAADEAAFLWLQRRNAVRAPNYSPAQFAALDEQIHAQLDVLRQDGTSARLWAERHFDPTAPEACFIVTALTADESPPRLDSVLAEADLGADGAQGFASGLGWAGWNRVAASVGLLLGNAGGQCVVGLAVCGMHRSDPGLALNGPLHAGSKQARIRAARLAGDLGRRDTLSELLAAMQDANGALRFWAARSATLLGDRAAAWAVLSSLVARPGTHQTSALAAALHAAPPTQGHELLMQLDALPEAQRLRIQGAGWSGNARYVPWLIEQMANPAVARIAAEAFVNITGADFNLEQMESMPPDDFEDGPTDDPDDDDVELPEDIALPWPNVERIKAWWMEHRGEFQPNVKLFLGRPPSVDWCRHVLKTGFQRQRVHAAEHLCLVAPGQPLFPTSAPAWRQQRLMRDW